MQSSRKLLSTWKEDQTQKKIPLSTLTITAKAFSLFETASVRWFVHFKKCYSLHNMNVSGEGANADEKAAIEIRRVSQDSPQHPELSRTQGESHPAPEPYHRVVV
uniref:HTH CENPB-type domain-containing protein n=1 Tax=Paramormyrops kingsleyae TaxID=1676925 RepID=A0A3B3SIQ2_9TELE